MKRDPLHELQDFERMRGEAAPSDLAARIVGKLEDKPRESRSRRLVPGYVAVAFLAVMYGVILSSQASANTIGQVRRAFEASGNFQIRTYQIVNGSRTPIAETTIEGERVSIRVVNGSDTGVEEFSKHLSQQLAKQDPSEISRPGQLELMAEGQATASAHETSISAVRPQAIDVDKMIEQVDLLSERLEMLKAQLKRLSNLEEEGAVLFGGSVGAEYTKRLLAREDLWIKERTTTISGRKVNHYVLKDGLRDLDLYVAYNTGLPVLVRFRIGDQNNLVTVEDEYTFR